MKRRGFFGFVAGAAVAGPGMVKQAAAQGLGDLSLSGVATQSLGAFEYDGSSQGGVSGSTLEGVNPSRWVSRLGYLRRLMNSAEWCRRKKANWQCMGLDPDLAANRSLSLSAKIRLQREREFNRWLAREQSWLERQILGERDEY